MTTTEYKLGRIPEFDNRSRGFPIRALLGAPRPPRSYTWNCYAQLDQDGVGACVGFSWAAELAARPVIIKNVTNAIGMSIYKRAQQLDEWPGEDYEGSSVLGGAKAVSEYGFLDEYRWGFSLSDALEAISYHGPAVLGINWYSGMFSPGPAGIIKPTGAIAGGHAILANGISAKKQLVRLHNSWGTDWGINGDAFLSFEDLGTLLKEEGECCIPVRRNRG